MTPSSPTTLHDRLAGEVRCSLTAQPVNKSTSSGRSPSLGDGRYSSLNVKRGQKQPREGVTITDDDLLVAIGVRPLKVLVMTGSDGRYQGLTTYWNGSPQRNTTLLL